MDTLLADNLTAGLGDCLDLGVDDFDDLHGHIIIKAQAFIGDRPGGSCQGRVSGIPAVSVGDLRGCV